jgi:Asp-tRNA(Asn)/Glu-tRNA(Gln) amidotransferase B subunit
MQESKTKMGALKLSPAALAEMTRLIKDGTISGKIGKQILPQLLQVHFLFRLLLLFVSVSMLVT